MVDVSLSTVYFNEKESFNSTKEKLAKLISEVDNDLVESDTEEETFLDWFMNENENLLKENYGSFLELFLNYVKEHVEKNTGIVFKYNYLNDDLAHGYVISTAAAND